MSESKVMPYLMILTCVAVLACGQVLFKEFSLRLERSGGFAHLTVSDVGVFMLAGILYAASSVIWVIALRDIPLSIAYPFMALGYILVPLAAVFLYGEHLNARYFLGTLLIIVGVVVTAVPNLGE